MPTGLLSLLAFAASFFLTRLLISHAPQLGLVQSPNDRSSHVRPTPSGGGIAVAIAAIACGLVQAFIDGFSTALLLWLLIGGTMAALGLADDLRDLRAAFRFPIQIAVVAGAIALAQPLPDLHLAFGLNISGPVLCVLLAVACIWWVNLFNFMDGIDGLAGSQTLIVIGGGLGLWLWIDHGSPVQPEWQLAAMTFTATIGFLFSNWPPARIFMGDAGSNFLAVIILCLLLALIGDGVLGYAGAATLASVFVSDATVTLVRRVARGERPWAAHRRHAYQQLARRFGHRVVTIGYALLSCLWALPLSILASLDRGHEWPIAAVAFLPLIILAIAFGAGIKPEDQR